MKVLPPSVERMTPLKLELPRKSLNPATTLSPDAATVHSLWSVGSARVPLVPAGPAMKRPAMARRSAALGGNSAGGPSTDGVIFVSSTAGSLSAAALDAAPSAIASAASAPSGAIMRGERNRGVMAPPSGGEAVGKL